MKKLSFFILTIFTITLIACNKKDETIINTKAGMLTAGSWILTAVTHDNDGDGTYETDDFSGFSACYRDDIWTFRSNGELQFDEGPTKCDPGDPQTNVTKWQLTNNETMLVIDTDPYSIEVLNNSTLKLKETLSSNRSAMVTFTKR